MTILIGLGRADLTPPLGTELAGFGPYLRRRATSVVERLQARAVAVGGDGGWVLVSCDLLGVSEDVVAEVQRAVSASTGLPPHHVVVHATHSHSGPSATPSFIGWGEPDALYLAQLPGRIAAAAVDAFSSARPSELSMGRAPLEGFAYNRMLPSPGRSNAAGLARTWATEHPELTDTHVEVVRIDADGALLGFLAHYSCHPVICCEATTAIHGDFPAIAIRILEAEHPGATGLFLQGALGDLDPTYAHGSADESAAALQLYGERFSAAVADALAAATPLDPTDTSVGVISASLDYRLAPVDRIDLDRRLAAAEAALADAPLDAPAPGDAMAGVMARSLRRTTTELDAGRDVRRPVAVVALRVGGLRIAAASLELFHEIKRRVRERTGLPVWVLSTTNGYLGYGPATYAYQDDSEPYPAYEVPYFVGHLPFAPDIADRVVAAMIQQLADLDIEAGT